MIDSSEKCNRQLAFELQNLHVCEKRGNMSHQKHVWRLESFFTPNRSQSESEKNDIVEEQCINQEETNEDQKKLKKSRTFQKTWSQITHGCAMKRRWCSAIFVRNLRQTPLHQQKDVQILEPQLCIDIKTVKNMRMLLMKKLWGIHSTTHSTMLLEHNHKSSSQQWEPSTGWPRRM